MSDAAPKSIQQIEFFGKLKRLDDVHADSTESMKFLKISEKANETRLKFSRGNVTIL